MAKENMQEYGTSVKIVDETVRIAKEFLETHPEEIANPGLRKEGYSKDATQISIFLGWETSRVSYSLQRLNLIQQGALDKEAIESMPTERHAREFRGV